jgi:hypothetical protein
LPELEQQIEDFEGEDEQEQEFNRDTFDQQEGQQRRPNKKSKNEQEEVKQILNPYETEETSYLIPLIVTVALFIPLLFCLCKL